MSRILSRNEFINEVYNPMMGEKEYRELQEINEGLLGNLFGKLKNWNDWLFVKGDKNIIKAYREIDNRLTGFTTMKMKNKDDCKNIRQELVNFAYAWYDYKIKDSKENKKDLTAVDEMSFEDKNLAENLKNCQDNIKKLSGNNKQMSKWAELLMSNMKNVINSCFNDKLSTEEKKKAEKIAEKQTEEDKKVNSEELKEQSKELEEIGREREECLKNAGCEPLKANVKGNEAAKQFSDEFKNIVKEISNQKLYGKNGNILESKETEDTLKKKNEILTILKNNKSLGLGKIFENTKITRTNFVPTIKMLNKFYESLGEKENDENFKNTAGLSIQAMCISINTLIKNSMYGTTISDPKLLDLLAKCATVSDGTEGFSIPQGKDEKSNWFIEIMTEYCNKSNPNLKIIGNEKKENSFIENLTKDWEQVIKHGEKIKKQNN